jgi:hypothetical protein
MGKPTVAEQAQMKHHGNADADGRIKDIVSAFQSGQDTVDIAKKMMEHEWFVERLLHVGLDMRRHKKLMETNQ